MVSSFVFTVMYTTGTSIFGEISEFFYERYCSARDESAFQTATTY